MWPRNMQGPVFRPGVSSCDLRPLGWESFSPGEQLLIREDNPDRDGAVVLSITVTGGVAWNLLSERD